MSMYHGCIYHQLFLYVQSHFSYTVYHVFFSQYFGNMTHIYEIGNFSGVLLKIGEKFMTAILQLIKATHNNHCLGWQVQSFKHYISVVALVSNILDFPNQFL